MTVVGKMDADYFELTVLDPESDVIDRAETKFSTDDGLEVRDRHIVWAHNFINKYCMPARMINMIAYKYACVEYLYDTATDNCDAQADLKKLLVEMKEKSMVEMKEKSIEEVKPVDKLAVSAINKIDFSMYEREPAREKHANAEESLAKTEEKLESDPAVGYIFTGDGYFEEPIDCFEEPDDGICEKEPAKHAKKPAKPIKKCTKEYKKPAKPTKEDKKDKKPTKSAKTDYNSNEDSYEDVAKDKEEVCEDSEPEPDSEERPSYVMQLTDPSIKDGCRLYGIRLYDATISLATLKDVTLSPSAVPRIRFMFKDGEYFEFSVNSFLEAGRLVAVYKKHLDRYESVKHRYCYPTVTFGRTMLGSSEIQYLKFSGVANTMTVSFNNSGTMSIICNGDEFIEYSSKLLDSLKGNDSSIRS